MNARRRGRFALVILDGVGIGEAPDAAEYGDEGSNTLGNVARAVGGLDVPYLASLGLGCCRPLLGVECAAPRGAYGIAVPSCRGKDSVAGHWEICGLTVDRPFPTYPGGFPQEVVDSFARATGRQILGNCAASGTEIIERLGEEHMRRGAWIVYTSADSVFQLAAHEEVISLDELYAACEAARRILVADHAVARVIARPFRGRPGAFTRTANRRDYSLAPTGPTLLDRLADEGVPRVGVGKVDDLFAGRNISSTHTSLNERAYALTAEALDTLDHGLVFANVIQFDQDWGHRNDVSGFRRGLEELDAALPDLVGRLRTEDVMLITADHGNDPTTPSTDHSREIVPILAIGPQVVAAALGDRPTFADIGATAADYFGVQATGGTSMLPALLP